jgi:hypothetical protein
MISNVEQRNFDRFMRATGFIGRDGKITASSVEGAYDAMPPKLKQQLRRGIPLAAFGRGGAFDSSGAEVSPSDPLKAFRLIASKLSAADWADLQLFLCGETPDKAAEPEEVAGDDIPDNGINQTRGEQIGAAMDARASAVAISPDLARIVVDTYGAPHREGLKPVSSEARQQFLEMFPDAARVKFGA